MKLKSFKLSSDDIGALRFLWDWKLLTTAALCTAIYKNRSNYRTYRRLCDLEKMRLIKSLVSNDGCSYVWMLDEKGFELVCDYLPKLKSHGYKSENRDHDFWVTAIHLGSWLFAKPVNCETFSEQQLRRYDFADYPDWVPKTSTHRPDGWWMVFLNQNSSHNLIALEVELSLKTPMAYKSVGEYYSKTVRPYQVIWVVKSIGDFQYIIRHLTDGSISQAQEQSCVLLEQYLKLQWHSPIALGKNQGQQLISILGKTPEIEGKELSGLFLLDTHKCPTDSTAKRILQKVQVGLNRNS